MDKLLILIVLLAVGVAVAKLRSDAAKDRKEVMARLAAEREQRGGIDYSPTAELFREVGVRHDPGASLPRTLTDIVPPPPPADLDLDLEAHPAGAPAEAPVTAEAPITAEAPVTADGPVTFEAAPADLRSLFRGISMPAGLRPLGPLAPENASFVTSAPPAEVHAGLDAEFARLDCAARWVEPTVAQTERNGMRGLVTIYPNPLAALDLDGSPLFPDVEPGHVVVRMLAL